MNTTRGCDTERRGRVAGALTVRMSRESRWRAGDSPALHAGFQVDIAPNRVLTAARPPEDTRANWEKGVNAPYTLRAHAPDQKAPLGFGSPYSERSLQVVVTPCCQMAFPDVISANLSLRARTPTPAALVVHLPVSSHKISAFPEISAGRRFSKYPCSSNFSMGKVSRLQSVDNLQARRFARHPGCSHRNTLGH